MLETVPDARSRIHSQSNGTEWWSQDGHSMPKQAEQRPPAPQGIFVASCSNLLEKQLKCEMIDRIDGMAGVRINPLSTRISRATTGPSPSPGNNLGVGTREDTSHGCRQTNHRGDHMASGGITKEIKFETNFNLADHTVLLSLLVRRHCRKFCKSLFRSTRIRRQRTMGSALGAAGSRGWPTTRTRMGQTTPTLETAR